MMNKIDVKLAMMNGTIRTLYKEEVLRRIHLRYDINDETDLLFDPDEAKIKAHNEYVAKCKEDVKSLIRELGGEI
jgi:hypothetical protein